MDTWVPPAVPGYNGNSKKTTPRMITSSFGDGYKQNIPDGLNAIDRSLSYTWADLTPTQLSTMTAFLEAHIGVTFYWTPPLQPIIKLQAMDWTESATGVATTSLIVNFERRYDF